MLNQLLPSLCASSDGWFPGTLCREAHSLVLSQLYIKYLNCQPWNFIFWFFFMSSRKLIEQMYFWLAQRFGAAWFSILLSHLSIRLLHRPSFFKKISGSHLITHIQHMCSMINMWKCIAICWHTLGVFFFLNPDSRRKEG